MRIQIAAPITRPMIPVTKPAEASPFAVLCLPTLPVEMAMMPRITPIKGINRDVRMLRMPVTREMVALLVGLCTATGTGAGVGDSFAKESAAVAPVGIGACVAGISCERSCTRVCTRLFSSLFGSAP